jgi:hypothetical protein
LNNDLFFFFVELMLLHFVPILPLLVLLEQLAVVVVEQLYV